MPPRTNTLRQPQIGTICAAIAPPTAEPSEKPTNIVMTIVARLFCGLYSEVSAIGLGMAPPRPSPVRKRHSSRLSGESAVAVSTEQIPKASVEATMTGLRPMRSASRLKPSAPMASPIRPHAMTGASAPGIRPHALLMVGAT
jgi:hypothetical protein